MPHIDPLLALGVALSTAATDAVYVMFNAAVSSRKRVPAATWSSVWYLLSAFAVISYTRNWVYVCFAAVGSWIGAYISMTLLKRPGLHPGDVVELILKGRSFSCAESRSISREALASEDPLVVFPHAAEAAVLERSDRRS